MLFKPNANGGLLYRILGLIFFNDNILSMFNGYNFIPASNHLWTISMEEQFYLALPFIIPLMLNYRRKSKFMLVGLYLFILLSRFFFSDQKYPFIYTSPLHFDAFFIGIIMGLGFIDNITTKIYGGVQLCIGLLCVCSLVFLPNRMSSGMSNLYLYILIALGFWLIVDFIINDKGLWSKFFRNRLLSYLGKISYGLYIFHIIVIAYVNVFFEKYNLPRVWGVEFFVALLITIMISVVSFELLERPFLKLKDKFAVILSR